MAAVVTPFPSRPHPRNTAARMRSWLLGCEAEASTDSCDYASPVSYDSYRIDCISDVIMLLDP